MNFLIVTGLSGAGKSMAVNALEDIGFFCIDNIPAGLLPRILDFAQQGENQLSRVAVVMDIRGLHSVQETNEALEALDEKKMPYDILFLDASDAAIRRRYKETRRVHPMTISEGIPVSEAITKERQILQPLRERAKYVIDTSLLSTAQNRERVSSLFLQKGQCAMSINVVSFGFKYGLRNKLCFRQNRRKKHIHRCLFFQFSRWILQIQIYRPVLIKRGNPIVIPAQPQAIPLSLIFPDSL